MDKFNKIITSDFGPYGLHRAREQRFFEGEKIISLRKTPLPFFTYTNFPCYVSLTFFVIKPADMDLKYLTGLLNSKIMHFWLNLKGKKQGNHLQVDKAPLLELPIYKVQEKNKEEMELKNEIVKSVDTIIKLNEKLSTLTLASEQQILKLHIKSLENKIDEIVFKLYDIDQNERKIIEGCLV